MGACDGESVGLVVDLSVIGALASRSVTLADTGVVCALPFAIEIAKLTERPAISALVAGQTLPVHVLHYCTRREDSKKILTTR